MDKLVLKNSGSGQQIFEWPLPWWWVVIFYLIFPIFIFILKSWFFFLLHGFPWFCRVFLGIGETIHTLQQGCLAFKHIRYVLRLFINIPMVHIVIIGKQHISACEGAYYEGGKNRCFCHNHFMILNTMQALVKILCYLNLNE